MKEVETVTRARQVKPGMRILINAKFSINLSLAPQRSNCVPMTILVLKVKDNGTSVLIEDMSNYMYEVPRGVNLKRLTPIPVDTDKLMPSPKPLAQTFNGVSIE